MCLNVDSKNYLWEPETQIKSEFLLQNAVYCKLLLTCRRTMCVSAVACSGSVQALSDDPVSHFHTGRYKLTIYAMYVQCKILISLRNHCCIGKPTVHSILFLELDDIFKCLK
jgi:hypothetical protein